MKNPTKLMGLVKTVGDKLDGKMKSGELKESELIAEATEIMNKMKNMPGMDNIQAMLSKMGMSDIAGMAGMAGMGGKVNMGAMESQLNNRMKMAKTKERIRAKAEANAKAKEQASTAFCNMSDSKPIISDEEILKIFSTGEKVEKTPRGAKPPTPNTNSKKGKKKNNK